MSWYHYLTALAAAATANATIEHGPVEVPEDAEILELEKERHQRLTVPVMIQGQGPFRFMIDTGSEATVVSNELADMIQSGERRPVTLVGMASRVETVTIDIEDFNVGSRSFYIRTAPLIDAENLGAAHGILGLDMLQDQRVLIDFSKRELAVADAKELGGDRGFEIIVKARPQLGQLIIADAMIDDVKTTVIIDTGAQSSIGNIALLERLRRSRDLGEQELTDVNGRQLSGPVRTARVLTIGRMRLSNFPVLFVDAPPFHSLGLADKPTLVLGMRELQLFRRVAIDFKKRQVLFDLPRNVKDFRALYGRRIGV